jgi:hypothetical protein
VKTEQRSIPVILFLFVLGAGALLFGIRVGHNALLTQKAMVIVSAVLSLVIVIVGIVGLAMQLKKPFVPFLALGWVVVTGVVFYKGQMQILAEVQGFSGGLLLGLSFGFLGLLGALGVYGVIQQNLAGLVGLFMGGIGIAQIQTLPPMSSTQLAALIIGIIPALPVMLLTLRGLKQ